MIRALWLLFVVLPALLVIVLVGSAALVVSWLVEVPLWLLDLATREVIARSHGVPRSSIPLPPFPQIGFRKIIIGNIQKQVAK